MADFTPTHVFVDGSSFLYRAYYSSQRNDFRNSNGDPIGAIMIFSRMLHALRKKYHDLPLVVVFDAHGKCFRKELYSEYKANRKRMPEDLAKQEEIIKEIIVAMGCDLVVVPEVEADDVLGTYSKQARDQGAYALICSGDKDLFQLVNDHVVIEDTMNDVVYDLTTGQEKFGVPPELMVDFLALKGDSSDNIPGMPKVGDVTAKLILNSIGSIETIKQHLDQIKDLDFKGAKTFADKFTESLPLIELSYQLALIKRDVELPILFKDLKYKVIDVSTLSSIYKRMGLHALNASLLKEYPNQIEQNNNEVTQVTKEYKLVCDEASLDELIAKIKASGVLALAPITSPDDHYLDAKMVGIAIATSEGQSFYIPLAHSYIGVPKQLSDEQLFASLEPLLNDHNIKKVSFNSKLTLHILQNYKLNIDDFIYDPMIEAYLLNSSITKDQLSDLAQGYLDYAAQKYEDLVGSGKNKKSLNDLEIEPVKNYANERADLTIRLHNLFNQRIEEKPKVKKLYHEQYLPMLRVLTRMERNGVAVSLKNLRDLSVKFEQQLVELEERIYALAGHTFKVTSPKQVAQVLFTEQKLMPFDPILKKQIESGKLSTNEEILSDLAVVYELPALILQHRGIAKLKNTYTDVLPTLVNDQTERIHTTFHLNGTITGRLSSSDPNLQNIPIRSEEGKLIRQSFIARRGYKIVAADYSQIELRILANLSQDQKLISAFNSEQDIHRLTASEVLGIPYENVTADQRRSAKAINFGIIYGMSAFGLAKQLKIDRKVAKDYIESYFAKYPSIKSFLDQIIANAKSDGFVKTINDREIIIKDLKSSNPMLAKAAERVATNAPMQGSAADVIQLAMIKIDDFIQKEAEKDSILMILQVHDELVFEIREDLAEKYAQRIKEIMENVFHLAVNLDANVGIAENWELAH